MKVGVEEKANSRERRFCRERKFGGKEGSGGLTLEWRKAKLSRELWGFRSE